jgi:hypothetical protein
MIEFAFIIGLSPQAGQGGETDFEAGNKPVKLAAGISIREESDDRCAA